MKVSQTVLAALAAITLAACSQESQETDQAMSMPGSDVDAHGCRASAGYRWCEATQECERPWELAREKGFDETEEAFAEYCGEAKEE